MSSIAMMRPQAPASPQLTGKAPSNNAFVMGSPSSLLKSKQPVPQLTVLPVVNAPIPPPLPTRESTHGHFLIPMAPPLPTREMMNKHYLSRNKSVEKVGGFFQMASNFVSEVAHELVDDVKYYTSSSNVTTTTSIPIPPPLPTRESTHGHYLIPMAPPLPTREMMNKHYLSRNRTVENATGYFQSARQFVENVASEIVYDAKYYANAVTAPVAEFAVEQSGRSSMIPTPPALPTRESTNGHYLIPLAPPLPTRESTHGHFLIPMAPALPTEEDMNVHYLSRDKTIENATGYIQSAKHFVEEVASEIVHDAKYYANAAPSFTRSASVIPAPPALPTRESTHGHYLIPMAPPLPTREMMNKHYLSRNRTVENATGYIQSAKQFVENVASEIVYDAKYYATAAAVPLPTFARSESVIPTPPALPTRESTHGHFLIPMAPPLPTREMMNKHYLSRNKTFENAGKALSSAAHLASEMAEDVKESIVRSIPTLPNSSTSSIPIPPPLPTRESTHGHYLRNVEWKGETPSLILANEPVLEKKKGGLFSNLLHYAGDAASKMLRRGDNTASSIPIPPPLPTSESTNGHFLIPVAPALPTEEDMNVHYLSRDKTIENTGSYIHNAAQYVREVVEDVKVYITETPIDLHRNGIPIPPPLPNNADLNGHFLIPEAPVPPTEEDMNLHYLSRDKRMENAGSFLKKAAYFAAEVVEDVTGYVAIKGHEAVEALPTKEELAYVVEESKQSLIERGEAASESVSEIKENIVEKAMEAGEALNSAKEAIVEKAIELKEAVLPSEKPEIKRTPYARYEVLDESSIFVNREPKSFYNRMILARNDSASESSLLEENREKEELRTRLRQAVSGNLKTDLFSYAGNKSYMPHQINENREEQDLESSIRFAPSAF